MSFQEYPKYIKVKGEDVLIHGADEEAKLTGKSEASVAKEAEKNAEAGEAAQAESDEKELDAIEAKGSAVTEADIVKLTEAARKDQEKRKPGRPAKG